MINHDTKFPVIVRNQDTGVEEKNNDFQPVNSNVTMGGTEEVTILNDFDESFLDANQETDDAIDNESNAIIDSEGIGNE